jgi:hypothetical protein
VKCVLDTNVVTRVLKGDQRVLSHLADVEPSDDDSGSRAREVAGHHG